MHSFVNITAGGVYFFRMHFQTIISFECNYLFKAAVCPSTERVQSS